MLDQSDRTTILRLHEEGHAIRAIARLLGVSRASVKGVLAQGSAEVPTLARSEKAEEHRAEILELVASCKGNLVRVHEELVSAGAQLSYSTLTGFCRRHGIGSEPPKPAGRYEFAPGKEMQHDTSPHQAEIGGTLRSVQTASLVLCFSHSLFFQMYPCFTRFECKIFLTEGARYFDGVCEECMSDNTHVVVSSGSGPDMIPAPEMAAFAERLGTTFIAHKIGDANRSARVERPFHFIENNFLAGRSFRDWEDLNQQARAWCDKVNATGKRGLGATPRELYATERLHMRRLPAWLPEVYRLHHRIADSEGYVNVHTIRYSVPWRLMGRQLEVRETRDQMLIFDGPRQVAVHRRVLEPVCARVTTPEHRPERGELTRLRTAPSAEQLALSAMGPEMDAYATFLRKRGRTLRALQKLLRMAREYPRDAMTAAVVLATRYGMDDLDRLESLVLRHLATEIFTPPADLGSDRALPDPQMEDPDDR